jgi:hypothetical protein
VSVETVIDAPGLQFAYERRVEWPSGKLARRKMVRRVLCVAEKGSIARAVVGHLAGQVQGVRSARG